jgi:hypothetical protein
MARESLVVTARFRSAYRRSTDALNNLGWLPNLVLRVTVGFMFFSGAVGKLGDLGKFTWYPAGVSGTSRGYGRRVDHGHRPESGAEVSGCVGFPQQFVLCPGVAAGGAAAVDTLCGSRKGQLGRAGRATFGGTDHRGLSAVTSNVQPKGSGSLTARRPRAARFDQLRAHRRIARPAPCWRWGQM